MALNEKEFNRLKSLIAERQNPDLSKFTNTGNGGLLQQAGSFGTGILKGAIETTTDTARMLQTGGQAVLAGIDPTRTFADVKAQTGLESLKGTQAEEIDALLKAENTAEKAGKLTAFLGSLFIPSGTRQVAGKVASETGELLSKGATQVGEIAQPVIKAGTDIIEGVAKPENIMQRVARINPSEQVKFKDIAGETVGEYLTKRKIFGNQEQITQQLVDRFQKSKTKADNALAKLKGEFKPTPVKTILNDLFTKEKSVSSPGALSPDLKKVIELKNKFNKSGLSMSEINDVKRLYERNVKLDFLKQNLPEGVKKANNLDNAIRKWQVSQAEKLGLKNLPTLNKETQYSKMLADALGKKLAGSQANNAFSLTDWIVLAGGDPTALSAFFGKKILSSGGLQSKIAKTISKNKGKFDVSAEFGKAKPELTDLLNKFNR